MIVWGGVLTVSIGALFLAGIIPGLLIGFVQMATVHVYAKLRGYPTYPRSTLREAVCAMLVSIPALMTPVIIIGGKIFGWFATDLRDRGAVCGGAVSLHLPRNERQGTARRTARHAGWPRSRFLRRHGERVRLAARVLRSKALLAGVGAGDGHHRDWLLHRVGFLVVGCFLDAFAIIIVGTILQPLAMAVKMDPVHFAMIGFVSLAFGLVTPPYGLCLLISCAIARIRMIDTLKDVMIMLVPMLAVLALLIVWPDVALFLPRLISPEFLK
jgi:TRAP-type C4-dicarboxylate transport system permease large subunit